MVKEITEGEDDESYSDENNYGKTILGLAYLNSVVFQ